jgi:tetratricopeptide (TPR) repeat protein
VLALSASARRLLCLLSLMPGDESSDRCAAALAGCPLADAAAALAELSRRHLLAEHRPGRFRAHDLIRTYAAELADRELDIADREAARDRLLGWYYAASARADTLLRPSVPVPVAADAVPGEWQPELETVADALDWFETERDNLIAAVSAGAGRPGLIWRLAASMRGWLQRRAPRHTWIELYRLGVAAARADGDLAGEATLLTGLAIAHSLLLEQEPATQAYRAAIDIFERIGDAAGAIDAIASLGGMLSDVGAADQALPLLRQADERVAVLPDLPDLKFKIEMNLGYAHRLTGDREAALRHYYTAAEFADKSAERPWLKASVLRNIGSVQFLFGEYQQAAATYRVILDLAQQTGDRTREAEAMNGLAEVAHALGHNAEAAGHLAAAIEILQPIGSHLLEGYQARLAALLGDDSQLSSG